MNGSALVAVVGSWLVLAIGVLAAFPALAADLQWGADVSVDAFARSVRVEVGRAYQVAPEAVSLEGLPASGRLPLGGSLVGADALRVRDLALRTAAGRSSLPVDILGGGKLRRVATLPVRVTVWSDVVLTRGGVPRGTVLTPDLLMVERRQVQGVPRGVVTAIASAMGRVAALDLMPRTVLAAYLLKAGDGSVAGSGVRSGSEVTVRVQSGGLSLVGKGRVLDSGAVGKDVRVRLLNFPASKVVKARVFSAQEVRVVVEDPS